MRRPTLHKSSIIVGLIVAFVLMLIIVPGRSASRGGPFPGTGYAESFEHGWPQVYFERTVDRSWPPGQPYQYPPLPNKGIPWLGVNNWRLWEAMEIDGVPERTFSAGLFALDVAVAAVVVAIVVTAWEFRRRRRTGPLAFRLADLLVALTAASLVFGWLAYCRHEYERERQITSGQVPNRSEWTADDRLSIAPSWVQAFCGSEILPEYIWRTSSVSIHSVLETMRPVVGRPVSDLAELSYLRRIYVETDNLHPFDYSQLRPLRQIESLSTTCGLNARDVSGISQLDQLRLLKICDLRDVDPELIARLAAALPKCRIIDPGED